MTSIKNHKSFVLNQIKLLSEWIFSQILNLKKKVFPVFLKSFFLD